MIKRFGVDANIISGNTDQLKDRIYGTLLIVIEGPQKALEDSLDYLNSQNLQVEVIGYVKLDYLNSKNLQVEVIGYVK